MKCLTGHRWTIGINNFQKKTVQELQQKIQNAAGYPVPFQRIIFKGQDVINTRSLRSYNVSNSDILHVLLRRGTVIEIDKDRYLDVIPYQDRLVCHIKSKLYLDLNLVCGDSRFWSEYGLFHDGKEIMDNQEIEDFRSRFIPINMQYNIHGSLSLKTKDGKLHYLESLPLSINAIIKKYLNKNDIDLVTK